MIIFLNQKETSIDSERLTVAGLIEIKNLPGRGMAIAVNNKVVRKNDWESTALADGDKVTVITAVCGG